MYVTTLTKTTPDLSVGHLYEHLFSDYATGFFRRHGLFAYVDYYLNAKTFHDGTVVMAIETYTEAARAQVGALKSARPHFSTDAINGALLQIMAEFTADIVAIDNDLVASRSSAYSQQAWTERADPNTLPNPNVRQQKTQL